LLARNSKKTLWQTLSDLQRTYWEHIIAVLIVVIR
jgi:hypothetical protein